MNEKIIEKVVKILPVLGLVSLTFIVIENINVRSQNNVLATELEVKDTIIGVYDTRLSIRRNQIQQLIDENQSLRESMQTKKKKA